MSISHSMNNALTGMNAASRMAEVVSSNVSNALTDGYGRRSLTLTATDVGGRGAGVQIGNIDRNVDRGIIADRRLADASLGGFTVLSDTLNRVENIVGQAGSADSISSRIVAVESALIDAAADPSSTIRLTAVADRLNDVAKGLKDATGAIQDLRTNADRSIADQVTRLNSNLSRVERLNADITASLNTNNDPSALMDERQRVIDDIAEMVPVREYRRDGGQVALMTPSGEMMIDGKAKTYDFTANSLVIAGMSFATGELQGISYDGAPLGANGIGKLAGGTLGAAFQARDVELVKAQAGLDDIAGDLIARFADPAADPTLAGDPGLLVVSGAPFVAADPSIGLAGRISLNAIVDPAASGDITKIRDGLNAVTPGPSGNATILQSLSAILTKPLASPASTSLQSMAGRASTFEASTGAARLNFESELSFANARWSSLTEAEAAGGVDTDFEMQMLLRVEQAYAANARVIQAAQTMLQRLMEI